MSAQPIGPGSILICTSTALNEQRIPELRLTMGALYCVAEMGPWAEGVCDACGSCQAAVVLKGKDRIYRSHFSSHTLAGYCPSQFRPLNDGDASLVENEQTDDTDCDGSALQTYRRILEPAS